ncbi:hypothetical protein PM082_000165 [Marasmius tenuissimus]|nr:hypothetical protein PM082_000165 [Marasmius tenuissimus]
MLGALEAFLVLHTHTPPRSPVFSGSFLAFLQCVGQVIDPSTLRSRKIGAHTPFLSRISADDMDDGERPGVFQATVSREDS